MVDNNNERKDEKSKRNIENRTALDEFENQKFADDVPMEDLKIELKDEKKKTKSKDDHKVNVNMKSKAFSRNAYFSCLRMFDKSL
ncbi:hypothetical protein [Oceanobacillus kimchii]|uniref:hypothetical protein n=1 Tax=Oceanobacillus kimchii TaxID=746691 RepID=UPI00034C2E8D|nr:hypothetical protein [Oceanobacillus kimchii]